MNSYQTANAAHWLAGKGTGAGVRHGRSYFFQRALEQEVTLVFDIDRESYRSFARMAGDLQLDYTATKLENGRSVGKSPLLAAPYGGSTGGTAAAKAGGTSWLKFDVGQRYLEDRKERVFFVRATRTGKRTSMFTRKFSQALDWAARQERENGPDDLDADALGRMNDGWNNVAS